MAFDARSAGLARTRPVRWAVCCVILGFFVAALSGVLVEAPASAVPTRAVGGSQTLTASELATFLAAGVNTTRVPATVDPPLATAGRSTPIIGTNGCTLFGSQVWNKPCVYGDTQARTSVVLFGDSHATAWFPAVQLISLQRHWRLVIMGKAGCPPVAVEIVWWQTHKQFTACTEWRRNSEQQISALHPALVIVSWARYLEVPEARQLAGVPTEYDSAWQNGVAATFRFLARAAKHAIFISDVPTLAQPAVGCIAHHTSDVRPCTNSVRAAVRLPEVKDQELALARQMHVHAIDPTSWFCAPRRCPVIVHDLIVYRDNAHMTPPWSEFISPLLAGPIRSVMRARTAGGG